LAVYRSKRAKDIVSESWAAHFLSIFGPLGAGRRLSLGQPAREIRLDLAAGLIDPPPHKDETLDSAVPGKRTQMRGCASDDPDFPPKFAQPAD